MTAKRYNVNNLSRVARDCGLWAMLTRRAGQKIVISLLVIVIRYLLPLLVSTGHVLESTSNDGTSTRTDMVFYI